MPSGAQKRAFPRRSHSIKTKPRIALDQIEWACANGLPRGDVIADAGYGAEERFRAGITELGLRYVVGVKSTNAVWAKIDAGSGEASMRMSVEKLALALADEEWRRIGWRSGTNEKLGGRFARARVRVAIDAPEEWLLIEWPADEKKPTKFWLSTLRPSISFAHLVARAKLRWRIERDYLELKQEIGLGHFEGRPSGAWLRQDAGEDFNTTPRSASRPTAFWSPREPLFPPAKRLQPGSSKRLSFPKTGDRAELPARTQRHVPDSIATLRHELAVGLAATLGRCPCCTRPNPASRQRRQAA